LLKLKVDEALTYFSCDDLLIGRILFPSSLKPNMLVINGYKPHPTSLFSWMKYATLLGDGSWKID